MVLSETLMSINVTVIQYDANGDVLYNQISSNLILYLIRRIYLKVLILYRL